MSAIERLARLIENDWSYHIHTGDKKNDAWKKETITKIASGIRAIKQEIILPSRNTASTVRLKFNQLFTALLTHDLKEFEKLPIAEYPNKNKRQFYDTFRLIVSATLPLLGAWYLHKYEPELLPYGYEGVPLIIAGGWLFICLLLWLDPQMGEKINLLRAGKSMFGGSKHDD